MRNAVTTSADVDDEEPLLVLVRRTTRDADDENDDCPEPDALRTRPTANVLVESPEAVVDAVLTTATT